MPANAQETSEGGRDSLGLLLTHLHLASGTDTRASLTARVNRGRSVIGYLLSELQDRDLIVVNRAGEASRPAEGGRPSHRVSVSSTAPVVIAAQINAGTVAVSRTGLGGVMHTRREEALSGSDVVDGINGLCAAIADEARQADRLLGIGLAVPSPIRQADGYAPAALHLGWPGVPMRDLVADGLRRHGLGEVPFALANDANLAAVAEYRHGAGRDARLLLYLTTARVGLGGAMISDGRLFTGAHGYGMEPGHITVDPAGEPCSCGSTGCLEVQADHRALLRLTGQTDVPLHSVTTAVDALLASADDDPATRAVVRRVAGDLGAGLANLVNLTDTDRIVLGGALGRVHELEPEIIAERIAARALLPDARDVPIRAGELADSVLLGAAELAFQPLLDNPKQALRHIDS